MALSKQFEERTGNHRRGRMRSQIKTLEIEILALLKEIIV